MDKEIRRETEEHMRKAVEHLLYEFSSVSGNVIPNKGAIGSGMIILPENFTPFNRAVLMDLREMTNPFPVWRDIILNILAFIPIGLVLAYLMRGRFPSWGVVLIITAVSFGLSLNIELLQSYLPRRWSTAGPSPPARRSRPLRR